MTNDFNISPRSGTNEQTSVGVPIRLPATHAAAPVVAGDTITLNRSSVYYFATALLFFIAGYVLASMLSSLSAVNTDAVKAAVKESLSTSIAQVASNSPLSGNSQPVARQVPTNDANKRFVVDTTDAPFLGPANALVTVVEFTDFQYPFCGAFAKQTEQSLLKKYEGKIRFVYRDFPLRSIHPFAQGAAEAANCANDQQKFWEYHDILFQNQDQLAHDNLLAHAKQLGLDLPMFETCLNSGKYTQKVENGYQAAFALALTGTPTFFVNGRMLVGAQPLSAFSAYIDAELTAISTPAAHTPGMPSMLPN